MGYAQQGKNGREEGDRKRTEEGGERERL